MSFKANTGGKATKVKKSRSTTLVETTLLLLPTIAEKQKEGGWATKGQNGLLNYALFERSHRLDLRVFFDWEPLNDCLLATFEHLRLWDRRGTEKDDGKNC